MTTKLVPPKEITQLMMLTSIVSPGKGNRKNKYVNKGLRIRNVNTGVYAFRRSDGEPLGNIVNVRVQVTNPWCNQKAWTLLPGCARHGHVSNCPEDETCKISMVPTEVDRWSALVKLTKGHLEVGIFKNVGTRKRPSTRHRLADGAGFVVAVMLRSDR